MLIPLVHVELSGPGRLPLRNEREEILAAAQRCIGSPRFVNDDCGASAVEWFEIAFSLAGIEMV